MKQEVSTSFKRLVLLTIVFIYLVILAGGIVRSTGSGMGCPDWPRCFGKWIPPTEISELPPDYKERFKVAHHVIADFNAFKTWIEYVNRLLGAIVGGFVLATFVGSLRYRKSKPQFVLLACTILILTGLQGWIGAKVVASNLAQYMITLHMLIALLIVSLALWLYQMTDMGHVIHKVELKGNWMFYIACFTLLQILLGTQIRQEIDTIAIEHQDTLRETWISELSWKFQWHRAGALVAVALNAVYSFLFIRKEGISSYVSQLLLMSNAVFFVEYLAGVGMVKWDIPYFIQPVHLMLASLAFGLQFYIWLLVRPQKQSDELAAMSVAIR